MYKIAVIHDDRYKGKDLSIVAEVQVDKTLSDESKLEEAFRLTNSIDHNWWENKEVTAMFSNEGCRSTSVDDFVLIDTYWPFFTRWRCDDVGWTKI